MTGEKNTTVQGTKANGEAFSGPVYYTAITTYQHSTIEHDENGWYVSTSWPQGIKLITDSEGILSKRDQHAILK